MSVLKYLDPGTGNYLEIPELGGSRNWATTEYMDDAALAARNYTDWDHPAFIGGVSEATDIVMSTVATNYIIAWETFDAGVNRLNNVCTLADLSSKGILLTEPWFYMYRLRVSFKTLGAAAMSVVANQIYYANDGATTSGGSANEQHASNTSAGITMEITSVLDVRPSLTPFRLAAQVRCYGSTAVCDSASLYVWGPLI